MHSRGLEQGTRQGLEQGSKKKQIEIAKNMINKNIDIELVSEVTGLSKEAIKDLK